jgi:subtilisin family serine protease
LFIPAGEKPRPDRAVTSPAKRSLARPNTAGQRADSIDAGDSYLAPHGRRALRRLPGSVVVRFDSGVNQAETLRALVAANGPLADYRLEFESAKGFSILAASRARREIEALRPAAHRQAIAAARGARGIRSANPLFVDPESGLGIVLGEALVVRLHPGVNPQDYFGPDWPGIQRLRGARDQFILPLRFASAEEILADASRRAADPRVSWAEPELFSEVIRHGADPLLSSQWHLNNTGLNGASSNADVNAPEAWSLTAGDPGIVIALLDDGTQLNHPDLSARIFSNPLEVANGFDDDHNGYVDDLHGWDFFRDDNDPGPEFPEDDHGTATAGVAAASANNSAGGAGIRPVYLDRHRSCPGL